MEGEHKYINLSYLEGIAEGDKGIIKELVEIFIEQIPEFTNGFEESMLRNDWVKVAAIAHKAKSSVMSMGMDELGSVDLKNMELLAKQLRIIEISAEKDKSEKQNEELDKLTQNLESYPEDRVGWIVENANNEKLQNLIDKFNSHCERAVGELNVEISTY